jgi:hypothetical protein
VDGFSTILENILTREKDFSIPFFDPFRLQ